MFNQKSLDLKPLLNIHPQYTPLNILFHTPLCNRGYDSMYVIQISMKIINKTQPAIHYGL